MSYFQASLRIRELELLTTKKNDRGVKKYQNKIKDKQTNSGKQKGHGEKTEKKFLCARMWKRYSLII